MVLKIVASPGRWFFPHCICLRCSSLQNWNWKPILKLQAFSCLGLREQVLSLRISHLVGIRQDTTSDLYLMVCWQAPGGNPPGHNRQHRRLSICGHFGWVWQTLSEANPSINWWWDEQICISSLCLTNPVKTRIEQDTSIEYNKSAHYLVGCHQVTPAPVWSFWVSSPFFLTKLFNVGEAYFPQNYPWTKCQM